MGQESSLIVLDELRDLTVDQFGRALDDPDAIRAAIPAWHLRNDGDDPPADDPPADDPPADEPPEDEPDTFDRAYVEKLRKENAAARKRAQEAEQRAKQYEDAQKSDVQKKDEALAAAKDRASYADKLDVALEKAPEGMTPAQVRKLAKRLSGSTREELEADAEELFADFASDGDGGGDDSSSRRRPRERLRPGAAPGAQPEETDPQKLAELIPPMY